MTEPEKPHSRADAGSSEREKAGELVSMLSSAANRVVIGNINSLKLDL